jgi:hypothetical protein
MQPVEVYDILMRDGIFICDPAKASEPMFFNAYDWLNEHLNNKDSKPDNVCYPVWAWYRYDSKEKKPDLRRLGYGARGEKLVCMELEVPDDKVLLSDFDLWHFVLNDWWLDNAMFKEHFTEDEYDRNQAWFDNLPKDEQGEEKNRSWNIIFNIEPFINDWIAKGQYVQAVFWELKKEYVQKAQPFIAK